MFGQNEIVGKKFFKDAPQHSIFVTSIFYTLQGEGPLMMQPSVFVRLAKCNLDCNFCDTYFDHGEWLSYDEIMRRCNSAIRDHFKNQPMNVPKWAMDPYESRDYGWTYRHPKINLVITGGEPMLQDNLAIFLRQQSMFWKDVQIESNGTMLLKGLPKSTILVISPKCINGRYANMSTHDALSAASALKFVVSADFSSPYHNIPDWALKYADRGGIVYVSPMNVYQDQPKEVKIAVMKEGVPSFELRSTVLEKVSFWEPGLLNLEANRANHEYAAKYAMDHGLYLNLQAHLYASLA